VLAAVAAVALLGTLAVWAPAQSGATPGEHLWDSWVFTSDVYEDEEAVAVTVAPGGCPVTVGTSVEVPGGDTDIRYVSHEATTPIWRWNAVPLTWDGPAGSADTAAGVVTDAAGHAYVAGTTTVAGGSTDIVLLKILGVDPAGPFSGDLLWARQCDGAAAGDDQAEAIAADAAGNVYVTGGSVSGHGDSDVITVKYRPDGTREWVRTFDSPSKQSDRGLVIAVRGSSVYVGGVSRRTGHADDIVLIRYTTAGARKWVRYYDDPLHRSEVVSGIACAGSSIYLCGAGRFGVVAPGDAVLLKYDGKGARAWARYSGGKAGSDNWSDVAVDGKGRVHVAGTSFHAATADDIAAAVYRPDGVLHWGAWFSSAGSGADSGQALAVDATQRTYVCGSIQRATGDSDVAVLCYGPSGVKEWFSRYPDPAWYLTEANWGDDRAADIALVAGAVYVAAASTVYHVASGGGYGGTTLDFTTLKFAR
jgi:hypothetical protein